MPFIEHCERCKRSAPPSGAAAEGWMQYQDEDGTYRGFVCPNCQTEQDIAEAWPDTLPEAWSGWRQRQGG